MAFKATLSPQTGSALATKLQDKALVTIAREADRVGQDAMNEARKLARQRLYVDRPASRRRAGSRRYESGFSVSTSNRGGKISVTLKNASKVAKLLENGSPAHVIKARSKDTRLYVPQPWEPDRSGVTHEDAYGGKGAVSKVNHPGTEGYHIMRDAMRIAFRRRGAALAERSR